MDNELTRTVFGDQLGIQFTLAEAINLIHANGLLNIGELAEKAISCKSQLTQAPRCQEGFDFINKNGTPIEVKHGQTHKKSNSTQRVAYISKKNKEAHMLAIVTEAVTGKQYYFSIPYHAYKYKDGNAFDITFTESGAPITYRPRSQYNWWNYEVKSFAELCEIAVNL
jgi:hypothetical protein